MPGLTMCVNDDCPLCEKCYRYTAEPNKYQSFSCFVYDNNCRYYIEVNDYNYI